MKLNEVGYKVEKELIIALGKYSSMKSMHEGYAVILEELDELWDEIKKQQVDKINVEKEALQVAAMAMRFLVDCCD